MIAILYRLAFCLLVIPLGLLWLPFALSGILLTFFGWLFLGFSEDQTDKIMAGNFTGFPVIYLDWLLKKGSQKN